MIRPGHLNVGDAVGIVSTARKVKKEEIQEGIKVLNDWGFQVIEGDNLYAEDRQFAGTDEQRTFRTCNRCFTTEV